MAFPSLDQSELLSGLTDPQREAVTHVDGPLLIIAAAGSGKTRVITRRVAYLMSLGIPPSSVLAITFTNKAAGEMKERVGQVIGRQLRDFARLDQFYPTICTFHSLCMRILRHYGPTVGLPDGFSIFDTSDQTRLIKDALKALDLSTTNFAPGAVLGQISNAKNQLQTPAQFEQGARDFFSRTVARVYHKYQQMLDQQKALDFDDLLMKTVSAFRTHPQMLAELQERFAYILIDEYQDTNHAQYMLAHVLAQKHRNICVVGDPDQSIYAWRGADIGNILDFEKDYADAKVVRLEQNYRSTPTILAIADKLIKNNQRRKDKRLLTDNPDGDKADLVLCQDEHDEARVVTALFKQLHEKEGYGWNDMAVFYRMNALSRVMEDELRRAGVPYVMARGVEFYNRKEIKDVMSYLRVIVNPSDEVSLTRIVNTPTRGIGDTTIRQIQSFAIGSGISLYGAMGRVSEITGLSTRAVNAVRTLHGLLEQWRQQSGLAAGGEESPLLASVKPAAVAGVRALMEDVVRRSGLEEMYRKEQKTDATRESGPLDNVNELISAAADFDFEHEGATLVDFVAQVSLVSDTDHLKGSGGAVTMMTLHAAKGLEFNAVAMIGLEEGVLPHARARTDGAQLEEERRLCFVGITRARRKLILTRALYRTIRGLRERTISSPFLTELPVDRLNVVDRTRHDYDDVDDPRLPAAQPAEATSSRSGFRRGQKVRHPTFGVGTIFDLSQVGQSTRAIVDFASAGRKNLIVEYARLEPLG